jgi:hypothetical protein
VSTPVQDAVLIGLTVIGLSASDPVTINASQFSLANGTAVTRAMGTAGPGTSLGLQYLTTASGNAAGTSDIRPVLQKSTLSGPYGASQLVHGQLQVEARHTAGTLGLVGGEIGYIQLGKSGSTTGNIETIRGYDFHIANEGTGNIATSVHFGAGNLDLLDGYGKMGTVIGFRSGNLGHANRVTAAAIGYDAANMTGGAPLTASYRSQMTAGTNKWGAYFVGDASNAFAGPTRFGSNHPPQTAIDVTGDARVTGAFRFANGVTFTSGPGTPAYPAARGSMYLSTDFGPYENRDGGMGWFPLRK